MDSCSLWILFFFYSTNYNILFYILPYLSFLWILVVCGFHFFLFHKLPYSILYLPISLFFMDSCSLWISFFFYSTNHYILFYILQHGLYHILFTLNFISYLMPYLNHNPANIPSIYHIHQYLSSIIPFLINSSQDSANIMIRFHTYYSIFILFIDSCSLWILFLFLFIFFLFYKPQHSILYIVTWFISYPPIY